MSDLAIIATANQFKKVIQQDKYAIGALLKLYSYQTTDERLSLSTKHENGKGFNSTDGGFCSSLAQQYLNKGRLTEKQLVSLKKLLPKYHRQVPVIEPQKNSPTPVIPEIANTGTFKNTCIHIQFKYDAELVSQVKEIPGRSWYKEKKIWIIPISWDSLNFLIRSKFTLKGDFSTPEVEKLISRLGFEINADNLIQPWSIKKDPIVINGLKGVLREYQQEGVEFIESKNGRALVGDEMGLGKTIQALAWLQYKKKVALPALVICPASLKLNWARETLKFTELQPVLISGRDTKKYEEVGSGKDLYIINYDIIHEMGECSTCRGKKVLHGEKCKKCKGKGKVPILSKELRELNFKTIIFDECHYVKTNGTGRTIAAQSLSEQAEFVISLSGTPIVNRPIEFYNAIQMTDKNVVPSWWQYTKRYCNRKHTGFGWDVSGSSNAIELHKKLTRTIMIRRLKKNVLKELPEKVRSVVPLEINLKKYKKIVEKAKLELAESSGKAEHLTILERAKQAVVQLKMKQALEWVDTYIENGDKIVLFAEHRKVIEEIAAHFGDKAVTVYGGTSQKARQAAVDRFQENPTAQVFIGSKAAKEGITLTAASSTAFFELWWVPGDHLQAEDRVHRIGQESDSVNAYYLLAAGTIEEDIAQMLDSKQKVITAVLDGKEVEEESMLTTLMNKINGEN